MGMVTAMASSSLLPCANSFPRGLSSFQSVSVKPPFSLQGLRFNSHEIKIQDGSRRRRGSCVAKLREAQKEPTVEETESEAREDEQTGMEGYKLKENAATEPVHLEMETVDDVVRPKRFDFDYGFQAKFLRTGPSVPGNVIRLAFENFGREWRSLRRTVLFTDLKRIQPSELNGPFEVVFAYTGRGLFLFLRGLDKFLTLYDGLMELKPLETKGENLEQDELRAALKKLELSNKAVWEREKARPPVKAPWWILGPYYLLCLMLDVIFDGRPIQRFWFLETVARMPYFSYPQQCS